MEASRAKRFFATSWLNVHGLAPLLQMYRHPDAYGSVMDVDLALSLSLSLSPSLSYYGYYH